MEITAFDRQNRRLSEEEALSALAEGKEVFLNCGTVVGFGAGTLQLQKTEWFQRVGTPRIAMTVTEKSTRLSDSARPKELEIRLRED